MEVWEVLVEKGRPRRFLARSDGFTPHEWGVLALVLLQNHLGNIQQGNINVRIRLLPLCHYPKVAVKGFAYIILRKPGYIYIGKPGEAGKDEQVPDCLLYTSRCV